MCDICRVFLGNNLGIFKLRCIKFLVVLVKLSW